MRSDLSAILSFARFAWLLASTVACLSVGCSSKFGIEQQAGYDVGAVKFNTDAGKVGDVKAKDSQAEVMPGESDTADEAPDLDTAGLGGEDALPTSDACTTPCTNEGECVGPLPMCQVASCDEGCCGLAIAEDGAECDDGNPCTSGDSCGGGACGGKAKACDDSQDCTLDSCDANTGKCIYAASEGFCVIDDLCYEDGASDPASACNWCSIAESQATWSFKPTCCKLDSQCPAVGACDEPHCDVASGKCQPGKKLGCCTADSDCDDVNACTADSCDLSTGNCAIVPKACPAPNGCQNGACDPGTGACKAVTKPGWCFIDSQCVGDSDALAGNPCEICASKKDSGKWSAAVGDYCSDGNACTFGDVCDVDGECKGTAQKGCCKTDSDCGPPPSPCQTVTCNASLGLCSTGSKAGCCTSGVCCDVFSHTFKAAKTPCADAALSTEYKCAGSAIQERETNPGCNGTASDGCTSNPAFTSLGPWTTIQNCGAGSACVASGSGVKPTCKAVSQCTSGACCDLTTGKYKANGAACGSSSFKTQWQCSGTSTQKRTGQQTCTGASTACSSQDADLQWSGWSTSQVCGAGTTCTVAAGGTSASCKAGATNSCAGKCGGQGSGTCYCDSICATVGDCCSDFGTQCCGQSENTCNGKCGGPGAGPDGCWCDEACKVLGDCCVDKAGCACP